LNDHGRHQAVLASQRLKNENIVLDAVWSSDLKRCAETAELIVKYAPSKKGVSPVIVLDEDLRERAMGELEGMSVAQATIKCEKEGKNFHDYGEPRKQAVKRLNRAFDNIVSESLEKNYRNIMIVSHGGVVSKFIHHLVTDRGFKLSQAITLHHLRVPHNASFTKVFVDEETRKGIVQTFGDAKHLEVKVEADQEAL
jgi:2,3-bisphosphoglycerate-dependent phosphoglycerate mutase